MAERYWFGGGGTWGTTDTNVAWSTTGSSDASVSIKVNDNVTVTTIWTPSRAMLVRLKAMTGQLVGLENRRFLRHKFEATKAKRNRRFR